MSEDVLTFSHMPCKYWSKTTKMSHLQRRIIIYSLMYYEYDDSCVSDKAYDDISHQLVRLMKNSSKEENEATMYWYAFYDFDGSTGFDIPSRLNQSDKRYLKQLVDMLYSIKEKRRKDD